MGQLWWYLARSSGVMAWIAATGSVAAGLVGATRRSPDAARRRWWIDLHRGFAGLACALAALHVITILADGFIDFTLADALVPFWGAGGDLGLAAGVLALYLLAAIEATSFAMHRLPRWAWRTVHETSFGLFALATVHASLVGTDSTNPAVRGLGIAGIALVVALTVDRLRRRFKHPRLVRTSSTT